MIKLNKALLSYFFDKQELDTEEQKELSGVIGLISGTCLVGLLMIVLVF